jgi:two-component system sensor histidine kinase QseC
MAKTRSLWRYLWAWALGAVVALWILLAGLAYSTGYHEADEISDGLLVSVAQLLLSQPMDGPFNHPLTLPGLPKSSGGQRAALPQRRPFCLE